MQSRRVLLAALMAAVLLAGIPAAVAGPAYPAKAITLIVPYAPGGSTDVLARAVSQVATRHLTVPLLVVNRPGGGAIPGRLDVVRAQPDGYTLLFGYGSGEDLFVPHQRQIPYDVLTDLVPVCRISIHSVVLVVAANHPAQNLTEFVRWAKGREQNTAAVSTAGGVVDVTLRLFAQNAGFKVTPVPGTGGADAITRLVGGHADFGGGHPSEVLPHIKAGRLRPLGVALERRDPAVNAPTFKEMGFDVVTPGSVKGVAVPKGTPSDVILYLAAAFKEISVDPEFVKIMKDIGQPIMYQGPEEYKVWFKQAFEQAGRLVAQFK
ncbi:MAG: tripartite tricarboxylate transporter substrate binding protein [Armatimonadota bacterium]|nr:tripartite tricarboxylate transporter substrate binding protein [Armatimonadota bacterium]